MQRFLSGLWLILLLVACAQPPLPTTKPTKTTLPPTSGAPTVNAPTATVLNPTVLNPTALNPTALNPTMPATPMIPTATILPTLQEAPTLAVIPAVTASGPMPQMTTISTENNATPAALPPADSNIPTIDIIVDNHDPGFSTTGTWWLGDGGQSYQGDCTWAARGIQNIAYVEPTLPVAGAYEIFAWWCGDPNHDQTPRLQIQIYPTRGRVATHPVQVNLQENAGQWNSLGIHYLSTDGFVSVDGDLTGNIVADAFRFVLRSLESTEVMPTPLPTTLSWTNHPPPPLEQLTAGDLTARLGIVQPGTGYPYTPILATQEQTFDDCLVFARPGCGGDRAGWVVQVQNRDLIVTYRVSQDYRHKTIEPNPTLAERQWLYLYGSDSTRFFRIDYYAYEAHTWNLNAAYHDGTPALHFQLEAARGEQLRALANRYGLILFRTEDGLDLSIYGLGTTAELTADDAATLAAMARAFFAQIP